MKTYVVIGGSSGIGEALVHQLASTHKVIATYHKHDQQSFNQVQYIPYDVTSGIALNIDAEQIDGLVYCPGSINLRPFNRLKEDDFIKDYQLNVIGAVKVIQQLLPQLKKADRASIVLFSTVAVQTGMNFHSLVASSKGAIEGLTRALAAELAPSIRVNCIAPSLTDTPLAAALLSSEEKREVSALRHPLKTIGHAQDLARLAAFLVTDESRWMTGQILHADGGMSSIRNL